VINKSDNIPNSIGCITTRSRAVAMIADRTALQQTIYSN